MRLEGALLLRQGGDLLPWSFSGYGDPERCRGDEVVEVLTPRATVATLAAGYRPVLHPSALSPRAPSGREER